MNLMMFLPGASNQCLKELAQVLQVEEKELFLIKAEVALPILEERYDIRRVTKTATPCLCEICVKARKIIQEIKAELKCKSN